MYVYIWAFIPCHCYSVLSTSHLWHTSSALHILSLLLSSPMPVFTKPVVPPSAAGLTATQPSEKRLIAGPSLSFLKQREISTLLLVSLFNFGHVSLGDTVHTSSGHNEHAAKTVRQSFKRMCVPENQGEQEIPQIWAIHRRAAPLTLCRQTINVKPRPSFGLNYQGWEKERNSA